MRCSLDPLPRSSVVSRRPRPRSFGVFLWASRCRTPIAERARPGRRGSRRRTRSRRALAGVLPSASWSMRLPLPREALSCLEDLLRGAGFVGQGGNAHLRGRGEAAREPGPRVPSAGLRFQGRCGPVRRWLLASWLGADFQGVDHTHRFTADRLGVRGEQARQVPTVHLAL